MRKLRVLLDNGLEYSVNIDDKDFNIQTFVDSVINKMSVRDGLLMIKGDKSTFFIKASKIVMIEISRPRTRQRRNKKGEDSDQKMVTKPEMKSEPNKEIG